MKFKVVATNEADPSDLESNADKNKKVRRSGALKRSYIDIVLISFFVTYLYPFDFRNFFAAAAVDRRWVLK